MILEPSEPTRRERMTWGLLSACIVVTGFGAIFLLDNRFFFADDTEAGAVGNWLQLGRIMRDGDFPTLVIDQWMAGNYPVEGQGGLWNPVQLAINYLAPSVDNLAVLAMLVKLGFSIVLALGVYRVALEYLSKPMWAAVAAASAPFTGFVLNYEQTSWVTALMGSAWLMQAWASGIRYARGKSGPVQLFAFLYLALTVGYVHTAMLCGTLIFCLIVGEYLLTQRWGASLRVAMTGIAAAASAAITFLPGILSADATWRTGGAGVLNDNSLTAPWSETLTASIPSSVSSVQSWGSETTLAPITYISWFAVPALAFIGWQSARYALSELAAPLILISIALLFTAGPSAIGPLRWPARLLPIVAITSLILLAVLLSRFGTTRPLRPRLIAAVILVAIQAIRASSSGPQFAGRHAMWGLGILSAGTIVVYLANRNCTKFAAVLILLSIVPIACYQVGSYKGAYHQWLLPTNQAESEVAFPNFPGTTLQLGSRTLVEAGKVSPNLPWDYQVFGNYAKNLNRDYVNAYTPIGHQNFSDLLCMEFDGSTCPEAFANAFRKDDYTGRTFVDLMLVDRVVLQIRQYPGADRSAAPEGWHWVTAPGTASEEIYVLERDAGLISTQAGRISATVSAMAIPETFSTTHETTRVSSANGGSVIFARLAWPGYTATLNGEPLVTKGLGGVFLYVDLPPGTSNAELAIEFRPPGWRIGFAGMGFGALLLLGLCFSYYRRPNTHKTPGEHTRGRRRELTVAEPEITGPAV